MSSSGFDETVLSKRAVHTKSFLNFRRLYAPQVRLNQYDSATNPEASINDHQLNLSASCEHLYILDDKDPFSHFIRGLFVLFICYTSTYICIGHDELVIRCTCLIYRPTHCLYAIYTMCMSIVVSD